MKQKPSKDLVMRTRETGVPISGLIKKICDFCDQRGYITDKQANVLESFLHQTA